MNDERCSLCLEAVDSENADILTMGGYGTPKYLCPECAKKIEDVMHGRDYDSIISSLEELNASVLKSNIDNRAVLEAISTILAKGAVRAKAIKEGKLDFDAELAAHDTEEEFEITEDLEELPEDKELDEKEAQQQKKLDKITSIICGVILLGTLAYLIWYYFFT